MFLIGRNEQKLLKLKETIKNSINDKIEVHYQTGDLNNLDDIKKIINSAKNAYNSFDILINSAGIFINKSIQDNTWEEFEESFNVNIRAPFIFCKEFSEDMIKNSWEMEKNYAKKTSGFRENKQHMF